jgi:protein SCO1
VNRETLTTALAVLATIMVCATARADSDSAAGDEHAHHQHAQLAQESARSIAHYRIPDVELLRDDGAKVRLSTEMDDGRPVVLAFIYTSCTTVCPLISHTLSQLQGKLGAARARVHLMSISIDPEQDSLSRLREYARTFHAGPEWQHYTGTLTASQTAQRAFDVYRGNKMDHAPATLIRAVPGGPWVRIDGFATADQLLAELPDLQAAR